MKSFIIVALFFILSCSATPQEKVEWAPAQSDIQIGDERFVVVAKDVKHSQNIINSEVFQVSEWLEQIEPVFMSTEYIKKQKYQSLYDKNKNLVAGLFMECETLDSNREPTHESREWAEKNKTNKVISLLWKIGGYDPLAQTILGNIYSDGLSEEEKNDTEAIKWYQKAAEQGYAPAQTNLGWMYEYGKGVKQSDTEAVKWYQKAAEQGYANAQFFIGLAYIAGKPFNPKQSDTEAVKWFQKAADQGHAPAQTNLGRMYFRGRGVEKDYSEARKWFQKAARQGDMDAQQYLKQMDSEEK